LQGVWSRLHIVQLQVLAEDHQEVPQDLAVLVPMRQVQELVAAFRQMDVQEDVAALSH